jgi:hypothetical protein
MAKKQLQAALWKVERVCPADEEMAAADLVEMLRWAASRIEAELVAHNDRAIPSIT